ncbi:hypothetical protein [Maribacter sp. 4G9]|uniref:hypothetical protein n=1 Tax=Maribacter sp. 4G9 TaxID=1889777 RepID=UPI000C152401|nr:hypothetical protein [Maribacter sp. 4G9]PIB31450.1 hypothetical protein BFP75_01500 [Maribacter sp. 4G9]
MAKQKKINTLDLIQQMAKKNKESLNTVEHIKEQRSPKANVSGIKQHFESKSVTKETQIPLIEDTSLSEAKSQVIQETGALKQLMVLLNAETFRDDKDTFTLSLSGTCLGLYEKLATGASYKMGIKTSRNDLIRKVLEDFISKKFAKAIKEIDLKETKS